MKVLLGDGSGLTARQCATRLATAGHAVHVLTSDPLCLCRFTRRVRGTHRVPAFGPDPLEWLDAALRVYSSGGFDVLFPTQEHVAVLSWARERLDAAAVATVVPPFAALAAVQDKLSATATLGRLGIPQPPTATSIDGWDRFPAFVKDPVGTASGGVRRVTDAAGLQAAAAGRAVVVQAAVEGPLAMCQSVFDEGRIVAFHANERTAEGSGGGASHKRSIVLPEARHWIEELGSALQWHGALSADVIMTTGGPLFIDVNPRLVEPQNAFYSGVDLVAVMMDLAAGGHPETRPDGVPGVATHQLLLAVLGAAEHGQTRRAVASELLAAARRKGAYCASHEELTPLSDDPETLVPVALAAGATLVAPSAWRGFTSGSVSAYALTAEGWIRLLEGTPRT